MLAFTAFYKIFNKPAKPSYLGNFYLHSFIPLNERVISELNFILEGKAQKRYGSRTWLLIRNAYPIWYKEDFELYKSNILLPDKHSFEEIWLLCDRDGSSGILQLY